jgi:hypothetical protein
MRADGHAPNAILPHQRLGAPAPDRRPRHHDGRKIMRFRVFLNLFGEASAAPTLAAKKRCAALIRLTAALFALLLASGAPPVSAAHASRPLRQKQEQQQSQPPQPQDPPAPAAPVDEEVESESVSTNVRTRPRVTDPMTIMRTARTIFVNSKTVFVKHSEVENALRKRPEFQAWGMVITRDEGQADLVIEIERKVFTKRFVFTVIEPRALVVVTSGKARSVIFGDTIAHKVAEKFVARFKAVRPFTSVKSNP